MGKHLLIGTFMGVEFYADPQVPSGTVVFENAKPSEPEVDYACGGTDTEPQGRPDGVSLGSMEHPRGAPVPDDADIHAATFEIMQMPYPRLSQEVLDLYETVFRRNKAPDLLAITRSIARGS